MVLLLTIQRLGRAIEGRPEDAETESRITAIVGWRRRHDQTASDGEQWCCCRDWRGGVYIKFGVVYDVRSMMVMCI
jgi:hypothetical protein